MSSRYARSRPTTGQNSHIRHRVYRPVMITVVESGHQCHALALTTSSQGCKQRVRTTWPLQQGRDEILHFSAPPFRLATRGVRILRTWVWVFVHLKVRLKNPIYDLITLVLTS